MERYAFDKAYFERLRNGDPETERHFASYFGGLILIKARARLLTRAQIDDVRQETFLRVLRGLRAGSIREPERLGAFVNSVCNNVLLELYRTRRHAPLPDDHTDALPADGAGPEDELLSDERTAIVRRIVDGLPERDRRILRAVFLEERDKDDVVAQLGVDRDYLRVLLHRAKMQFRARYRAEHGAGPAPRPASVSGTRS